MERFDFEFNPVPWTDTAPTRAGLYLVKFLSQEPADTIFLADVYPDRGNLLVKCDRTTYYDVPLSKFLGMVKAWSPRIRWGNNE